MPTHEIIISSETETPEELQGWLRRAVRAALDVEGVDVPCEIDVLLTNDEGVRQVNLDMRGVDAPTDVLSFPMFKLSPGDKPSADDADPATGLVPLGEDRKSVV